MTYLEILRVKHTVTYKGEPLVCFGNLPGFDAELTPTQIRALAASMLEAADECEKLVERTKLYGPACREYDLVSGTAASALNYACLEQMTTERATARRLRAVHRVAQCTQDISAGALVDQTHSLAHSEIPTLALRAGEPEASSVQVVEPGNVPPAFESALLVR